VHADASAKQPIAIVIPHEANLRRALDEVATEKSLGELCASSATRDAIVKECNAAGKRAGFKNMELLEAVVLTPDEWTPENGLVTAAQKVQRKKIEQRFKEEIKARIDVSGVVSSS
jgi:long-chain acyl-CoA synthetase